MYLSWEITRMLCTKKPLKKAIFEVWRWGVTCCSWTVSRGARWERTCAWPRTASRPPSARFYSSTSTVSTMSINTMSSLYFEILQRKDSCIDRIESTRRLEIPPPPFLRAFNGDGIFGTACWGRGCTTPFHFIYLCSSNLEITISYTVLLLFHNSVGSVLFPMLTAEWLHLYFSTEYHNSRQNKIVLLWKYLADIRSMAWLNLFWENINGKLFAVHIQKIKSLIWSLFEFKGAIHAWTKEP